MQLNFTKMQGCGNDYIYLDCFNTAGIDDPHSLAVTLSDRHYGIGGDGLVLILPSEHADARMRMFNLDGSEGKMCGNAIRCVAKYLYDNKLVSKLSIGIETLSGIKKLSLAVSGGLVSAVTVEMGSAELSPEKIPVNLPGEQAIAVPVQVDGREYKITCVSMGNPHAVVFTEGINRLNLNEIGPSFEHHELFPDRINTEFVELAGRNVLRMRVWERGSGETLACGTGACAAAVAAVLNGFCDEGADIRVLLAGGELTVRYCSGQVLMTGGCQKVFEGTVEL